MFNVGILTISTKGAKGQREDKSGEVIREMVTSAGNRVVEYAIIPDDRGLISIKLVEWADRGDIDVILSTGGTGLSDTDVTPEATAVVVDKLVPGIPDSQEDADRYPEPGCSRGEEKVPHHQYAGQPQGSERMPGDSSARYSARSGYHQGGGD
jgi:molybdopterin adenylyltransferase